MYSYASIINTILALGMETTFFRYLNKHEEKKREVYNNCALIVCVVAILFLISGLVFSGWFAKYILNANTAGGLSEQRRYVQYFVWILFIDAVCVIPFAKLRADGKPARYSIIRFANIVVFVGLNLFFIFVIPWIIRQHGTGSAWLISWYKPRWIGYVFLSNLIASIVTFFLLLPQFFQIQLDFDRQLFRKMFSYSWPVLIANLSFIVNENLDKILLSKYLPSDVADHEIGIYGAVCKLAIFISIFNTAFRLGAEPFFFSYAKNENAKKTYASILYYFVLALVLLFVGLVANIELLKQFIGSAYWSGLAAVPYLLFGYVCLGIYMNLSVWYRLSDQTRFGLYISVIGALFTIVMNIILIPKYSYMGSAWVSMMAYFIIMIISYLLGHRYYPIPYNLKRIAFYLFVSLVLVFLSFYVFRRNIYIGNALLIAFIIGIYMAEHENVKKIISEGIT
jgi:O-antigen/teichoic acid export membrane protein